jgi:uncharacterized membrane protein SpoIIM required for sporulation
LLLMKPYYRDDTPGTLHLALEGLIAACVGTFFGKWLFPNEISLVSIFLASIITTDSIERLLIWHRRAIFEQGHSPSYANRRLVVLIAALFSGATLGFSSIALTLPLDDIATAFSHQLADYGDISFESLHFGHFSSIGLNNIYVLLFFFAIAIPFRQGGVMLAIAWNSSVWGATFGVLARHWSEEGGPTLIIAYSKVMLACLPHMALEGCAYILAGFAGVFFSKALIKYSFRDPVMESIISTVIGMLILGLLLVLSGALWEAFLAESLVQWMVNS